MESLELYGTVFVYRLREGEVFTMCFYAFDVINYPLSGERLLYLYNFRLVIACRQYIYSFSISAILKAHVSSLGWRLWTGLNVKPLNQMTMRLKSTRFGYGN